METYIVALSTTQGLIEVELMASSAKAAETRAYWSIVHARKYGDLDDIKVTHVEVTDGS